MDSGNKYFIQKTENRKHTTDVAIRRPSSVLRPPEVGFPIRKFTDQSLFAAPHDLSQRTTSFIASQRQGIHQIPLRHLIALIANARRSVSASKRRSRDRPQNTANSTRQSTDPPSCAEIGMALDF